MAASRPGVERPISRDKARRQLRILELVREENISTQEDLAQRLRQAGLAVTQATVSRDIKELGLLKVTGSDGADYDRWFGYILVGGNVKANALIYGVAASTPGSWIGGAQDATIRALFANRFILDDQFWA